jgi:hypothetical protein
MERILVIAIADRAQSGPADRLTAAWDETPYLLQIERYCTQHIRI